MKIGKEVKVDLLVKKVIALKIDILKINIYIIKVIMISIIIIKRKLELILNLLKKMKLMI